MDIDGDGGLVLEREDGNVEVLQSGEVSIWGLFGLWNREKVSQEMVQKNKFWKIRTVDLILCALFAALIAVGAFIKIPIPGVPFTLQVLFTTLAGLLLGSRMGAVFGSDLQSSLLGLAGVPDFYWRRRNWVCGLSNLWLSHRIFSGNLCDWMDCRAGQDNYLSKAICSRLGAGLAIVYFCGIVYFYLI